MLPGRILAGAGNPEPSLPGATAVQYPISRPGGPHEDKPHRGLRKGMAPYTRRDTRSELPARPRQGLGSQPTDADDLCR
jgi:hypothetical protein